jgi:hypothetical protein
MNMTTPLDDYIEHADQTMEDMIFFSRVPVEGAEDGQVAIVLTTDASMEGPTLIAAGTVGNHQDFVAVTVSGFDGKQPVEPEVMIVGNEVIITIKNT